MVLDRFPIVSRVPMNAASISPANRDDGSDSDSNPDDLPEFYQPISTGGDDGEDSDEQINSDEEHHRCYNNQSLSNGISSLQVSEDSSEEEEDDRSGEAIVRAFREDESQRSAPLTAENATRVIEAMRGVSKRWYGAGVGRPASGKSVDRSSPETPADAWLSKNCSELN